MIRIQAVDSTETLGKPFKALDESSWPAYLSSGRAFLLYLVRRTRGWNMRLPPITEAMRQTVSHFGQQHDNASLQALLMAVFCTWEAEPEARDDHLFGDYLRVASILGPNEYAGISATAHRLIHLLFWARLAVFREITQNHAPEAETLRRIHSEYVFSFAPPALLFLGDSPLTDFLFVFSFASFSSSSSLLLLLFVGPRHPSASFFSWAS